MMYVTCSFTDKVFLLQVPKQLNRLLGGERERERERERETQLISVDIT